MKKLTKKNYITARLQITLGQLPLPFLRKWCEEDGRDFDVLMHIFNNVPTYYSIHGKQYSFQLDLVQRLIRHLDTRFSVVKLFNKQGEIIKIF